jgi:hypothetical protein
MTFKIIEQYSRWIINSDVNLQSKKNSSKTRLTEYVFSINSSTIPVDFFEYGTLIVVSKKIADIFKRYEDIKAGFSPVKIIFNGTEYMDQKFYVMQVFESIKCINYEQSNITYVSEEIKTIIYLSKLVTYPVDTNEHKLFLIDKIGFLCVDSLIGDELVRHNYTGFKLIDISDATI